jgi:hypothetical protein
MVFSNPAAEANGQRTPLVVMDTDGIDWKAGGAGFYLLIVEIRWQTPRAK